MRRPAGVSFAAVLVIAAGCGAGRWTAPTGPRTPAPDAAAAWEAATAGCRAADTWSASLRVSGRVDDERIPTGLSVNAGLTRDGRLRLEGRVLGRPAFTLSGSAARALLRLERERQFVIDRADDILARLLGTDVDPARLLAVLSGCGAVDRTVTSAAHVGAVLEVETPDARVYLRQVGSSWRVEAALADGFVVAYRALVGPWPSDIRLTTAPGASTLADLRMTVADVVVNATLSDRAFDVTEPDGWERVQLVGVGRAGGSGGLRE